MKRRDKFEKRIVEMRTETRRRGKFENVRREGVTKNG